MEQFSDLLKTRLKDPAYDFRQDSFLNYLKTPKRSYKESPTVKDYVDISEKDLERMATGLYKPLKPALKGREYDVMIGNGRIISKKEVSGVKISNITDVLSELPSVVWEKKGKEREEFLINASWSGGSCKRDIQV